MILLLLITRAKKRIANVKIISYLGTIIFRKFKALVFEI